MPGGGFSRSTQVVADPPQPNTFPLGDFSIDEYRPIKVAVIGSGFGGITAGIRFPQKIPNVELKIYEKSSGVGGVWFNNRYPGLACDIPAHCYQLSFEEKPDWSAFYAPGPEIRQYLQSIVDKYKLMRYIKLNHEVTHAQYNERTAQWHLRIRRPNPETGAVEEIEEVCDVVVGAFGALDRWSLPGIEGIANFKGELYHSAGYDPADKTWQDAVAGWKGKKIGVIGVGSSALQIVPALQPRVEKVVNYVRGKTWLAVPFASNTFADLLGRDESTANDFKFSEAEIERFKTDREFYKKFRHTLEDGINSLHSSTLRDTPLQRKGEELFKANMMKKLAKKPWIAEHLMPDFPVACRRLTPGPGYLEALCEDNVDFVPTPIKRFTESGIETADGKHQDLDVVFCATGYDTSFQLPFTIVGRNGVELNEKWTPHPVAYLSMCVDGFPNLFMTLGPNSGVGSGSLLTLTEFEVLYAVQAVAKLQRERYKSIEIKQEAVQDYDQYLESYFPKTVYSAKCRSWYKAGREEGRVTGLWPGSCLHAMKSLMHPRWEDYNYELADPLPNRMYWLGDGQTWAEKTLTGDRAWYLDEDFIDRPPVPSD